jgi:hypothetical protein
MKKFTEYITEGAPEGKKPKEVLDDEKSKITEEKFRLIDEAIRGRGFGGSRVGGRPMMGGGGRRGTTKPRSSSGSKKPIGGVRVSVRSRLMGLRSRGAKALRAAPGALLGGLKSAGKSFASKLKTKVGEGIRDMITQRTVSAIDRKLDRTFDPTGLRTNRERPYSQMMGSEKLQSGSVGSARADAERRRREIGL